MNRYSADNGRQDAVERAHDLAETITALANILFGLAFISSVAIVAVYANGSDSSDFLLAFGAGALALTLVGCIRAVMLALASNLELSAQRLRLELARSEES